MPWSDQIIYITSRAEIMYRATMYLNNLDPDTPWFLVQPSNLKTMRYTKNILFLFFSFLSEFFSCKCNWKEKSITKDYIIELICTIYIYV